MKKKYHLKNFDENIIDEISKNYNVSSLTSIVIHNRDLTTNEKIDSFLNTELKLLRSPFDITGMQAAVELVYKNIKSKAKIFIYGDYDADGVTSTAQLILLLNEINAEYNYYLPNRESDGYGLNINKVKDIINEGYNLLITLDCGISNYDEIDFAVNAGMEVLIIDHHKNPDILPPANVIIDPQTSESQTYYSNLCGAGLVFKFVDAYSKYCGFDINLDKYLQLAAIGTVSDIVPLTGENRIIVKNGIDLINSNPTIGIKNLIIQSGTGMQNITSSTLGYIIGPRINAAGRVETAEIALRLLITNDEIISISLAEKLNSLNILRKEIEKKIFLQADLKMNSQKSHRLLIAYGNNWNDGVIGIVSSRITEKYFKPSIIFSANGDFYKGSGRSIPGFDIYKAIMRFEHLTVKCGGHEQAVGLTVHKDNIDKFTQGVKKYALELLSDTELTEDIYIDKVITEKDNVSLKTVHELSILEPFGLNNEQPIFLLNKYSTLNYKYIGAENKHLKAKVRIGNSEFDLLKFNINEDEKKEFLEITPMVGQFSINRFNGKSNLQFNVQSFTGNYFQNIKIDFLSELIDKRNVLEFMHDDYIESESILITEGDLKDFRNMDDFSNISHTMKYKILFAVNNWIPKENAEQLVESLLNKNNSKIFKFNIIKLVKYISKIYNININEEKIIYTIINLNKKSKIDFKFKNNDVYIKYLL